MNSLDMKNGNSILPEEVREEILWAINRIAFGEVVITIHDSRVVQVEKREKTRFEK